MIRVRAGKNLFEGVLKNYEMEGDDLVIRFELQPEMPISLTLPKFPPSMLMAMNKSGGMNAMKNACIDLNTGNINLDDAVQSNNAVRHQTVTASKERRPGLRPIGGGSMVG